MMPRRAIPFVCFGAVLSLSACTTLPPYRAPAASADTATVDVSRINANAICVNGTLYKVSAVPDKKLQVPTDTRVALHSFVYISDYYMNYSCYPGVSFQPRPGEEYLMNLEMDGSACTLEVYRKDDQMPVGLALEFSDGPPQYCRKMEVAPKPVELGPSPPSPKAWP